MNKTHKNNDIILPIPSEDLTQREELDLYARFMRHLRCVPNSRMEIKVLSAIQFTADMMDYSDAHVAKELVDLGLRAPRLALPAEFLRFADQSLLRTGWEVGGPSEALHDLARYWRMIGEDKFAFVNGDYSLVGEGAFL